MQTFQQMFVKQKNMPMHVHFCNFIIQVYTKPSGALWSYFPNKANKWNIRKHEKAKKNC